MYKPQRIIIFLAVVLCIVLLPLLINHGRVAADAAPALDTPEINELAQRECVESTEYMRSDHMHLLDAWRTEVIRNGNTMYTNSAGQVFEMSLEDTCFSCHSNRAEFCLSCHDYAGVETNCWNCHDGGEAVMDR